MTSLIYAGIGSRRTPPDVLSRMSALAGRLAKRGYILRSGAADGADAAFEAGCVAVKGKSEIWLPWKGFNNHADTGFYPTDAHELLASGTHPAWDRLSRGPRALHSRNMGQVLGVDLATPVSFVLCWTPDGCESEATRTRDTGGTGMAIALASKRGIPVYNLANADAYDRFVEHVLADCRKFHPDGGVPEPGQCLVFGSNLAGIHGAGAALLANNQFGAVYGQGTGPQGDSYAIATKDGRPGTPALSNPSSVLPLGEIQKEVARFIEYAKAKPEVVFYVTRIGCGLAGYTDAQVAPMFSRAPTNCVFAEQWKPWLGRTAANHATGEASVSFSATRVVHVKESPYDVYIGRQNGDLPESVWANPFKIGEAGTREDVVSAYYRYISADPSLMGMVGQLKGKTLACWCKSKDNPHALCHGDVLAALADGRPWTMPESDQLSLF